MAAVSRATHGGHDDLSCELERGHTALVISSCAAIAPGLLGVPPVALIASSHASVNTAITKPVVRHDGTTLISTHEHVYVEEAGASLMRYR